MHRFLDVLVVAGGGERNAVFDEIKLPVRFRDHQPAVGRVRPRHDMLFLKQPAGGKAVQVGQQYQGRHPNRQSQGHRRKRFFPASKTHPAGGQQV